MRNAMSGASILRDEEYSSVNSARRHCVAAAAVLLFCLPTCLPSRAQDSSCIDVDHRALVSQSDLIYQSPAARPVDGQPIGNGRMGAMVWTPPSAVRLQINRCDVYATNKDGNGYWWAGPTDYCAACAAIAIDVGGQPFVAGKAFSQRLSLYAAEESIAGEGVGVRCFVSASTDVLALEIDDQRSEPQPICLTVSMWRDPKVINGDHNAQYEFVEAGDSLAVVQRFCEKDYHCASAMAACIAQDGTSLQASGEKARTIVAPAKGGKRTIFLSSAASFVPEADVGKKAIELLCSVRKRSYDDLFAEHTRWWSDFWSRTFVHLSSDDGVANFMERVRNLHLYYMASTSRGVLPPRWNGLLFQTEGDHSHWGAQIWLWTIEMLYFPLYAADAVDLTDPFFDMYVQHLPAYKKAAQQRWNADGVYIREINPFDGPLVVPEDVAAGFQDVLLGRKNDYDEQLLNKTKQYAGRYLWICHIASSGSELAMQAWWRYRSTGDMEWLRTHAYPLLRGTVEFYSHIVRKDEHGRYHLHGTNAHEDFWRINDSIVDLAAIRGTVPLAIRASEVLEVDADLRVAWQELLDNLAPYPMGSDPESKAIKGGVLADDVWSVGHLGDDAGGSHNAEDMWLTPVFPFEDWTLDTRSSAVDRIVQKTLDLAPRHASILSGEHPNTAVRTPIVAARAGRGPELPAILASYYAAFSPLPNGLSLFEADGPNDQSIEQLGLITTTLQEALLQSVSAHPGEPEIITVFPAWPNKWEASFRLLARGGFLVTSAIRNGDVEFVEIQSRCGEACRLRNAWGTPCLVSEIGGKAWSVDGDVLSFDTAQGGRYCIVAKNTPRPAVRRVTAPATTAPASYSWKLSNGMDVQGTLGIRR